MDTSITRPSTAPRHTSFLDNWGDFFGTSGYARTEKNLGRFSGISLTRHDYNEALARDPVLMQAPLTESPDKELGVRFSLLKNKEFMQVLDSLYEHEEASSEDKPLTTDRLHEALRQQGIPFQYLRGKEGVHPYPIQSSAKKKQRASQPKWRTFMNKLFRPLLWLATGLSLTNAGCNDKADTFTPTMRTATRPPSALSFLQQYAASPFDSVNRTVLETDKSVHYTLRNDANTLTFSGYDSNHNGQIDVEEVATMTAECNMVYDADSLEPRVVPGTTGKALNADFKDNIATIDRFYYDPVLGVFGDTTYTKNRYEASEDFGLSLLALPDPRKPARSSLGLAE